MTKSSYTNLKKKNIIKHSIMNSMKEKKNKDNVIIHTNEFDMQTWCNDGRNSAYLLFLLFGSRNTKKKLSNPSYVLSLLLLLNSMLQAKSLHFKQDDDGVSL